MSLVKAPKISVELIVIGGVSEKVEERRLESKWDKEREQLAKLED